MTAASPRYAVNPRCLLTELGDGTGVVLDLDSKFYFTLNRTGVWVWKKVGDGAMDARQLAEGLSAEFEVDPSTAEADVAAMLTELVAEGLVRACP